MDDLKEIPSTNINEYFKGKEGIMIFNRIESTYKSEYFWNSEDGKTFYNDYEKFKYVGSQYTGKLTSNLTMSGDKKGKMDLTLTMNYAGNIIFKQDGQKISYGYVDYNGKKMTIEDSYYKEKKDLIFI